MPEHVIAQMRDRALVIAVTTPQIRDSEICDALRDELVEAAAAAQAANVILNLEEVTFVGSMGFLSFLSLRRLPNVERIVLCHVSDRIRELFELCKLLSNDPSQTAPFLRAETVDDALAQLSPSAE